MTAPYGITAPTRRLLVMLLPAAVSQSLYKFYKDQLGLWVARAEDWVGLAPVPDWRLEPFGLAVGEQVEFRAPGLIRQLRGTWID